MKYTDYESGYEIILEGEYIIKFDEHRFYLFFSGKGMKAVDYLMIKDDFLYLIEIKNYRQYDNSPRPKRDELQLNFQQKCEDTLLILEKFYDHMQSSWWRKNIVINLGFYFLGVREWKHWVKAYDLFASGRTIMLLHGD